MNGPTVSCLMATRNGPRFVADALRQFQAQDYDGGLELVVLDNGAEPVADLCRSVPRVRYYREEPARFALGTLRNRLHDLARGDVFLEWDDDDWRAPGFVRVMVETLQFKPDADYAAILGPIRVQCVPSGAAWLWNLEFFHDGTLAIRRPSWRRFVDGAKTGCKAAYVADHSLLGVGVKRPDLFVYRVHGANNWATLEKVTPRVPLPAELREPWPELP